MIVAFPQLSQFLFDKFTWLLLCHDFVFLCLDVQKENRTGKERIPKAVGSLQSKPSLTGKNTWLGCLFKMKDIFCFIFDFDTLFELDILSIALDKALFSTTKYLYFSYFSIKNICCG